MARRRRKRRGYGRAPKGCHLTAQDKAFMSWLNRARTGHLDHLFLREARKLSRTGGLPGDLSKKLAGKIKRTVLKKKLVCAIRPGAKRRECSELTGFKPNFQNVAFCYLTKINFGWKGGK